jgi:hypothetical protein
MNPMNLQTQHTHSTASAEGVPANDAAVQHAVSVETRLLNQGYQRQSSSDSASLKSVINQFRDWGINE